MTADAARLVALETRDFRNLAALELTLPPEGLVIVGENGQGKTNLLEAVYYLQILRSARGARDQDLVRFGTDGFFVGATVATRHGERLIGVGYERPTRKKRVRLDGVVVDRLGDAVGTLPAVMFSPADAELLAGGPAARRRFLDILLALTAPGYLDALQRYRTALGHRNAALRDAARAGPGQRGEAEDRVAVWEPPLAEHGAVLVAARSAWVRAAAGRFAALCAAMGERAPVTLSLDTAVPGGDERGWLATRLDEQRRADLRRGLTRTGPHRDDLAIALDLRDMRIFGSAGQQRTAAIALRLLEAETLRARTGGPPVLLLDDPFAELDAGRSARILALLSESVLGGGGQTILAVPRETDIPDRFTRFRRLCMADGRLSPWSSGGRA